MTGTATPDPAHGPATGRQGQPAAGAPRCRTRQLVLANHRAASWRATAGPAAGPQNLVIGPLDIIGGKLLATADPAGYGDHGNYKIPIAVGPTVTVVIPPRPEARSSSTTRTGPSAG